MPTLSELRAIVRRRPEITTTLITNANLNTVLVEGALDLAKRGDAFIRAASFDSAASTQEYILSGASPKVSGFLDLYYPAGALTYTDSAGKIKTAPNDFTIVSERWLNIHLPGWRDVAASNTLRYAYVSFNSAGDLILGVHPKSSTAITNAFKLWYASRGTDMTNDAWYPWTGSTTNLTHTESFQKFIAEYAAWKIYEEILKLQSLAEKHRDVYLVGAEELRLSQKKLLEGEIEGLMMEAELQASDTFGSL